MGAPDPGLPSPQHDGTQVVAISSGMACLGLLGRPIAVLLFLLWRWRKRALGFNYPSLIMG